MIQGNAEGVIRPVEPFDLPALARLEADCFSDSWSEAGLESGISSASASYFLYEEKEKVIGYCGAQVVLEEGELLRIVVDEEARSSGIGSLLLEALFAACPQVSIWYLEVREGNLPAIALYRKFGFQPAGLRKNYYRNPQEHALLMRREKEEE